MTTSTSIPPANVAEAQRLVFSVLCHIVNHGAVELGTKESAQLSKANLLLLGRTVPADVERRASAS